MKQYETDLRKSVKTMKSSVEKEELHSFRLSIKKLKAISRLLNGMSKNKLKFVGTMSSVYGVSGMIREAQINRHLALEYIQSDELAKEYVSYQKHLITGGKLALRYEIKQIDNSKYESRWKKLYAIVKDISKAELIDLSKAYIKTELDATMGIDSNSEDVEDIHQIRKHTKGIYFIIKLLSELGIELKTKEDLAAIKSFSDKLGDWHDREVLYDSFVQYQISMMKFKINLSQSSLTKEIEVLKQENLRFREGLHKHLIEFEELFSEFC